MTARRHDEIVAAVLAQIETVNATLGRLHVPASAHDDLRQEVTIATWSAARHGRVLWHDPGMLRAYMRAVATWAAYAWFRDNPLHVELHDHHEAVVLDAERMVIARSVLRYLRRSTTSERFRAARSYANGVPVHAIAAREHVPVATVYNRLRLAREDFAAALRREDAGIFVRRK